jgi:hypothetical protein
MSTTDVDTEISTFFASRLRSDCKRDLATPSDTAAACDSLAGAGDDAVEPIVAGIMPSVLKKLAAILAAVLFSFWVAGCGSSGTTARDKYVGTWAQAAVGAQQQQQMSSVLVKKVGDKYAFTDPGGATSKLVSVQTEPDASGNITIFAFELSDKTLATKEGDSLKLTQNGHDLTITVNGDTMTWDESGNAYHFSRKASG